MRDVSEALLTDVWKGNTMFDTNKDTCGWRRLQ